MFRTHKWFKFVLKEGLGVKDYFLRFEFAKSRGFIHYHSLLWTEFGDSFHSRLNECLNATTQDELEQREQHAAKLMENDLRQFVGYSAKHPSGMTPKTCSFLCDPGGDVDPNTDFFTAAPSVVEPEKWTDFMKRRVNEDSAYPAGNHFAWPGPEGIQEDVQYNALSRNAFDHDFSDLTSFKDVVNLANRSLLHICSKYCLLVKKGVQPRAGEWRPRTCRFHYGDECRESEVNTLGRPPSSIPYFVHNGNMSRLELSRDHPRMQPFSPILLQAYRGNFDLSPVIAASESPRPLQQIAEGYHGSNRTEHIRSVAKLRKRRGYMDRSLVAKVLIDYVVSYACKAELTHDECLAKYKEVVERAGDNDRIISIAGRTGASILKARSVPATEADSQNAGLQYVTYSIVPRWFWLNGTRTLAPNQANDDESVKQNAWDKFLKRVDPHQSFHEYVVSEQLNHKQFPVYDRQLYSVNLPISEEYAQNVLRVFKRYLRSFKETLVRPEALKSIRDGGNEEAVDVDNMPDDLRFDSAIAAFESFVVSEDCPNSIRDALQRERERAAMRQLISNGQATNDAPEDVENDFSYADLDSACDSVDAFMETPVDICHRTVEPSMTAGSSRG